MLMVVSVCVVRFYNCGFCISDFWLLLEYGNMVSMLSDSVL